jgi:hypothetical protein
MGSACPLKRAYCVRDNGEATMRNKLYMFAVLLITILSLSGCMAAAALPAALPAFKTLQGSLPASGDGVEVTFKKNDSSPLTSDVRRVAIMPGGQWETELANSLEADTRFDVVTPNATSAALVKAGVQPSFGSMTDKEQSALYASACRTTRSDMLLFAKHGAVTPNIGFWTLDRHHTAQVAEISAFSCGDKRIVWNDTMTVKILLGGGTAAPQEKVNKIAGIAWANRLLSTSKVAQSN